MRHIRNENQQLVYFNRLKRCWVLPDNLNFKKPKVIAGEKDLTPLEQQVESEEEEEVDDGVLFYQNRPLVQAPQIRPVAPRPVNNRRIPVLLRRCPRRVIRPVGRYGNMKGVLS